MRLAWTAVALGALACSAPEGDEPAHLRFGLSEPVEGLDLVEKGAAVRTCQAAAPMTTCMKACTAAASLGCAGAVAACWFTDIITLGSTTLPCVAVSALACATGTGAVLTCDVLCRE